MSKAMNTHIIWILAPYFTGVLQSTRHNSADSVPTSNLVCIKEVAIGTTFYCWKNLQHLHLSF